MFKLNCSRRALILSWGCLLFALGGLLLASASTVVQSSDEASAFEQHPFNHQQTTNSTEALVDSEDAGKATSEARTRRGRIYGTQQQSMADSYAAAYAAATAAGGSNGPSSMAGQQHVAEQETSGSPGDSYASFGESSSPTSGAGSVGSMRHSDYPPQSSSAHSSYYSGYPNLHSSSYQHQHQHYRTKNPSAAAAAYPHTSAYDRQAAASYYDGSYLSASAIPLWAQSSIPTSGGGLMSSASSALSSWTGGFGIAEIICALVAISIGAIILGAPFFLIYLALMGNFSGSGTLSLTNPTGATTNPANAASATVNGRRKRLAIFEQLSSTHQQNHPATDLSGLADTVMNKLSPYIDMQQVAATFKRLVSSIDKYSNMKPETTPKRQSSN